ncbi:MAG TPA: bifunctional diaminohydroxyphosphoribosylaminopyrimidine deaminase/5-amino-6-(5-phosphoribosylamino)uracil reductase RibD [Candidatus Baltobacteraceae bacterium]|nr:bifunctional diaminohydroxyphosphoribosylaminopyrimidine deaminase/5-amino-6-(5-phosphoribosylamino)uracil reductase RibD [Candidatus Baltobacteraceae bacterium]
MTDYLAEAIDLAQRAAGNTFPNPLVGAIVERDGVVLGRGFHRVAGNLHAEAEALSGSDHEGATLYVTLEPCTHVGKQPPCVDRIIASGVHRVVVGALDPNPLVAGRGIAQLAAAGIDVELRNDTRALRLIEDFRIWITTGRPYVALKMASSLDGLVASAPETRERLTGSHWKSIVERLRLRHQAVMIGAGTALVDDPKLSTSDLRRQVPFVRIVAAARRSLPPTLNLFREEPGYARTIVLVPENGAPWARALVDAADVVEVPANSDGTLDLANALRILREERGIFSILCEGGPTLAAQLIAAGVVDRFYWAIAPLLLASPQAIPALCGDLAMLRIRARFDEIELVGDDAALSGTFLPA